LKGVGIEKSSLLLEIVDITKCLGSKDIKCDDLSHWYDFLGDYSISPMVLVILVLILISLIILLIKYKGSKIFNLVVFLIILVIIFFIFAPLIFDIVIL